MFSCTHPSLRFFGGNVPRGCLRCPPSATFGVRGRAWCAFRPSGPVLSLPLASGCLLRRLLVRSRPSVQHETRATCVLRTCRCPPLVLPSRCLEVNPNLTETEEGPSRDIRGDRAKLTREVPSKGEGCPARTATPRLTFCKLQVS